MTIATALVGPTCRRRRGSGRLLPDQSLLKQVGVVAGATRGAGRGVTRMLGTAGATVYLHRSQREGACGHRRAARGRFAR